MICRKDIIKFGQFSHCLFFNIWYDQLRHLESCSCLSCFPRIKSPSSAIFPEFKLANALLHSIESKILLTQDKSRLIHVKCHYQTFEEDQICGTRGGRRAAETNRDKFLAINYGDKRRSCAVPRTTFHLKICDKNAVVFLCIPLSSSLFICTLPHFSFHLKIYM